MAINDKKGINLTSGFKYVGGQPLDVRLVAEDESDLQSLVDNGATYNGMVVWVNSTSKRMVFNGSEFIEDVNPNTIGNINDVLEQINGGGTFSGGGSSSGGTSGLGQPIVLNYSQSSHVLTIPTALENGEYLGIITIANVYTLSINFYVDLNYAQFIGNTVSGELSGLNFIIGAYINRSGGWHMYANVLTLDGATLSTSNLGDLWELIRLSIGEYPTFTLYKKN